MADNPPIIEADLSGPDADGFAWLTWREGSALAALNLGKYDCVAQAFTDWLGQNDFGDAPAGRGAKVRIRTTLDAEE